MKKIYSIVALMALAFVTRAQVIPGGDMETWRTGTSHSGTYPTRTVHAPYAWFGFDSTIIYLGENIATSTFGLYANGDNFFPQVFQDNTVFHGGASSAKLITIKQDTLGVTGGAIANYNTNVQVNLGTGSFTYFIYGGTPVTGRIHSVSAWVQYHYRPGTIADTATMSVDLQKHFGTVDSTIGTSTVNIDSTSGGWQQVTAYVFYNDEVTTPDTIRITFSSSISGSVDSSTLNVDDVTMSNVGLGVQQSVATENPLNIFPNPATGIVTVQNIAGTPVRMELYSVAGNKVAEKIFASQGNLDVSKMAAGLYFYNVCNTVGDIVQKGKLEVVH